MSIDIECCSCAIQMEISLIVDRFPAMNYSSSFMMRILGGEMDPMAVVATDATVSKPGLRRTTY